MIQIVLALLLVFTPAISGCLRAYTPECFPYPERFHCGTSQAVRAQWRGRGWGVQGVTLLPTKTAPTSSLSSKLTGGVPRLYTRPAGLEHVGGSDNWGLT